MAMTDFFRMPLFFFVFAISILQFGLTQEAPNNAPVADSQMSSGFMQSAISEVAIIQNWYTTLGQALQRGVPGDGSGLAPARNKALEGLRLAGVSATNSSDHEAFRLLTNHYNKVDGWYQKLVNERKSMSTANYSLTPNALDNDPDYQKIKTCSVFLGNMVSSGHFLDNVSCH